MSEWSAVSSPRPGPPLSCRAASTSLRRTTASSIDDIPATSGSNSTVVFLLNSFGHVSIDYAKQVKHQDPRNIQVDYVYWSVTMYFVWSAVFALIGALPCIVPDLYGFFNYMKWGPGGIVVFIMFNLAPSLAGTLVGVMNALLGTLFPILTILFRVLLNDVVKTYTEEISDFDKADSIAAELRGAANALGASAGSSWYEHYGWSAYTRQSLLSHKDAMLKLVYHVSCIQKAMGGGWEAQSDAKDSLGTLATNIEDTLCMRDSMHPSELRQ